MGARMIQRRALEYGLVQPGQPVYTDTPQADSTVSCTYTSTSALVSTLTDEELDSILTSILETFPNFGRKMLKGQLPASPANELQHRIFVFTGANSLWHHDGQHVEFVVTMELKTFLLPS
ncbi:hypothetical protein B0H10DRAFT_2235346 [Mycena sp. CBHHK59/15]|nr:hypothetical protein B0H10DRAFT_2235346 [Mycena sp. CBHHK59/15]